MSYFHHILGRKWSHLTSIFFTDGLGWNHQLLRCPTKLVKGCKWVRTWIYSPFTIRWNMQVVISVPPTCSNSEFLKPARYNSSPITNRRCAVKTRALEPKYRLTAKGGRKLHTTWMSRWKLGWMVSKMGYNLLINGVYWGYNPLTNLLVTSRDIHVVVLCWVRLQTWRHQIQKWQPICHHPILFKVDLQENNSFLFFSGTTIGQCGILLWLEGSVRFFVEYILKKVHCWLWNDPIWRIFFRWVGSTTT